MEGLTNHLARWTLFVAVFTSPFGNLHISTIPVPHFMLIVLCCFLFIHSLLSICRRGGEERCLVHSGALPGTMVVFIAVMIISLVMNSWADYHPAILFKSWVYLLKPVLLVMVTIMIVIPSLVSGPEERMNACRALLAGYVVTVILTAAGFFQTHTLMMENRYGGEHGDAIIFQTVPFEWGGLAPIFPNRNLPGEILVPGLIFAIWYYVQRRSRWTIALIFMMCLLCLASQSKTTYLSLVLLLSALGLNRVFRITESGRLAWLHRYRRISCRTVIFVTGSVIFLFISAAFAPRFFPVLNTPIQFHQTKTDRVEGKFNHRTERNSEMAEKYREFLHLNEQRLQDLETDTSPTGSMEDSRESVDKKTRKHAQTTPKADFQGKFPDRELDARPVHDIRSLEQHASSFRSRYLQHLLAFRNLTSGPSMRWSLCGRGLRTWQYHLNNFPPFTREFGRFFNYGFQLDAHGIVPKVALEQGWAGVICLIFFSIFCIRFCLIFFQNGYMTRSKLGTSQVFSLVPLVQFPFFLLGTNYYQPVLWVPFGLALLFAAGPEFHADHSSRVS